VTALCDAHDVVFFDLDGVIYIGPHAVTHAPEVLAELRSRGIGCCFVTNNASRTPIQVAEHLTELGIPASADEVVTGSQAGAGLMSNFVEPGIQGPRGRWSGRRRSTGRAWILARVQQ
jgi:glycerol-1-phosphatase